MLPSPPSQTRTNGLPASGSSRASFAQGTAYWWTILAVRQRVSREHGPEALPRQIAVAATPCDPFLPRKLVVIPSDPSAVAGDAVLGAVPPDHPRQVGVLFLEWTMQVEPTPFHHGCERASVTVFCRYLPDDILTHEPCTQGAQSIMGRSSRSEAVRARQEVRLVNGLQQQENRSLRCPPVSGSPVAVRCHPPWACSAVAPAARCNGRI